MEFQGLGTCLAYQAFNFYPIPRTTLLQDVSMGTKEKLSWQLLPSVTLQGLVDTLSSHTGATGLKMAGLMLIVTVDTIDTD